MDEPLNNKCIYCGRFIAYGDIGTDKTDGYFVPDSAFTTEQMEFWHKSCESKEL